MSLKKSHLQGLAVKSIPNASCCFFFLFFVSSQKLVEVNIKDDTFFLILNEKYMTNTTSRATRGFALAFSKSPCFFFYFK